MTFYKKEIQRIRGEVYANQGQLDTVIGISNYVNHHYDNRLNLDRLSLLGYVFKFHLLRLFQKYYGQTPQQYLTDKRLEQAMVLLKRVQRLPIPVLQQVWKVPALSLPYSKTERG